MYLTVLLMMIMLLPGCCGYAGGAPSGTCNAMSPKHRASAQDSASSYTIMPSANTYDCGDTINVTLSGADFKGFLCQARSNVSRYSTVGSLTDTDNSVTTSNNCDGEAALTHTESGVKSSFQFSWTHSGASTENIYIVYVLFLVHFRLVFS
ncbi:putative defense protein 3 [Mercenaria mercenaria]|uniref:putative defense protein 3 n=1 Tax=Mercenaria mercenaria TaxID=6596 RepID=UPI00234F7FE5|nr:putative defense protein 3 [Mercenaria mercenaria]